jgi:hypothetical protein
MEFAPAVKLTFLTNTEWTAIHKTGQPRLPMVPRHQHPSQAERSPLVATAATDKLCLRRRLVRKVRKLVRVLRVMHVA